VLYQDNHLLVVNKPPGWHCGPNHNQEDRAKCILNHLLFRKLGGGTHHKRLLHPLHRIDQPCSGVLLLGRSSRAGQRLQPLWTLVRKSYVVIVTPTSPVGWQLLTSVMGAGADGTNNNNEQRGYWRRLIGTMAGKNATKTSYGWSVNMIPGMVAGKGRTVQLDWALVGQDGPDSSGGSAVAATAPEQQQQQWNDGDRFVLLIRTTQGARHMVRALLSTYGLAIVGDTRYKNNGTTTTKTSTATTTTQPSTGGPPTPQHHHHHYEQQLHNFHLPFVALHARSILLPTIMELGGLSQRLFTAPLPIEWDDYFHLREDYLAKIEAESTRYPYQVQ
jgi:23S rRNA-/tRNA-specific pseudouridylate synthase